MRPKKLHYQDANGKVICGEDGPRTTNRMKFDCIQCRQLLLEREFNQFHRSGRPITARRTVAWSNEE